MGHSAGGHLAALAAVTGDRPDLEGEGGSAGVSSAIQAAVPASPPTDFLVDWYAGIGYPPHEGFGAVVELLGGLDLANPEVRARARLASPARLATQNAAPVLVVHGTRDDLVPVTQGRLFVEALLELGADASLLELPDDDHGLASLFGDDWGNLHAPVTPAMEQTIDFFVRILGPVESV